MPDLDIAKWLWANAPSIAIALGVAKIYLKVSKLTEQIQEQLNSNTSDLEILIQLHAQKHPEDLPKLYRRKNNNG